MQNIVSFFFLVVVGAFFPVFCFFLSTIELCRLPLVAPVRSGPAKTECVAFAVRYNFDNSVIRCFWLEYFGDTHPLRSGRTDGRSFANSSQHQWSAVPSQTYHNSHYHHDVVSSSWGYNNVKCFSGILCGWKMFSIVFSFLVLVVFVRVEKCAKWKYILFFCCI